MQKFLNAKNKILIPLIILLGIGLRQGYAQNQVSTFIAEYRTKSETPKKHKHRHKLKLSSVPILIYQKLFSEQISANCVYELTCSRFGQQALAEFGLIKGFFLSLDRISRCNRMAAVDLHPVRMFERQKPHDVPQMYRVKK